LYAIIETGGKQYRVEEGSVLKVEKLTAAEGETVELDRILALKKDDQLTVGAPWGSRSQGLGASRGTWTRQEDYCLQV